MQDISLTTLQPIPSIPGQKEGNRKEKKKPIGSLFLFFFFFLMQ
jgi:hypothetical protein